MGGDACSKGREFKSQYVFDKSEINEKEAGVGPLKKDFKLSHFEKCIFALKYCRRLPRQYF